MKNTSWQKGPTNHIVCQPPHDRPIFSLAISDNNFVTGSADHGLREYNIQNGKHIRQLFAKKYGHKQWVSTCAYTPSGHIVSGGMDSMVCYWDSKGVKCDHFAGHGGSISKVMANQRICISSSYDATMILWDLAKKTDCDKLIGPHKQAIMTFDWHQSLLVSGDKSGVIGIWDINKCQLIRAIKTHKGAVNKILLDGKNNLIHSIGLNDGSLAISDMRTNNGIYKQMLHKGATNDIKIIQNNKIITCSADHTINILDINNMKIFKHINIKDMAFVLEYAYGVVVAGTASGNIIGCDINTGQILYGYGVIKKGQCRLLAINKQKNRLVCAGEDDSPALLSF